jgi:general stress protein 26
MSETTAKEQFDKLVEEIGVAMMTTHTAGGQLRSRAMALQKRAAGADFWFVAAAGSGKLQDLTANPRLNLTFYNSSSREWASVAGTAMMTKDRQRMQELYEPDWKMWFGDNGDEKAGTPDDPRMVLIGVKMELVTFFAVDRAAPMVLYELAKGWLTGTAPDLGEVKTLRKP